MAVIRDAENKRHPRYGGNSLEELFMKEADFVPGRTKAGTRIGVCCWNPMPSSSAPTLAASWWVWRRCSFQYPPPKGRSAAGLRDVVCQKRIFVARG